MMHNLFDNNDYLGYKFPEPQYLGAKFIHRGWIAKYIPESVDTVLDAFGGSQSVAYMMKQLGKRTLTNDFMSHKVFQPGWSAITTEAVRVLIR